MQNDILKDKVEIESILQKQGFAEYRWINPGEIITANWVRVKCTFGCSEYGLGACPPNTPSVDECGRFFKEYKNGLIIRLAKFSDRNAYPSEWSNEMTNKLLEVEKAVFLKGYYKTFLLNQTCCSRCKDCSRNRNGCKDKKNSRPSPESFAVDVYATARNAGLKIDVITDNPAEMAKIAILLVE